MTMRGSIAAAHISGPLVQPDGIVAFEFRFGADDPTFAGHFPERPVLPGVFQLEIARVAAESVLNCSLAIREISKAKFLRPILPEEIVRVDLKLSQQEDTICARARFFVQEEAAGETLLLLCRND
jgi:3-hydroxymyristoyl/3-hydroxydecanoyl-(acyl carrier protein) dehydratase